MHLPAKSQILFALLFSVLPLACEKSNPPKYNTIQKGDSIPMHDNLRLQVNSGVCIGNSIIAGHPWHWSGLELNDLSIRDTIGQPSWYLSRLTHFTWIDHGWGGQTTVQIKARFLRDAIGDTADPGDGRGAITLAARPTYVVLEGGVNDIAYRLQLDSIKANLAWMAAQCKLNHIHCIVLNCVGSGFGFDSTQIASITALNSWLASGALDTDQATIVDINSLWNSGTYGGISPYNNDNVHFSTLVNPGDGIHFTEAGYDSVAYAIYRVARLAPVYGMVH